MASSDLEEKTAVLSIRVIHYDFDKSTQGKVNTLKMKASVATTVYTLRSFMARQAEKPCNSVKLIFQNEVMNDSLTLLQHGIVDSAEISVLLDSSKAGDLPRNQLKGSEDAKSTGSKRRRSDDDMSVASKRTKVDDSMSVSTACAHVRETDNMSVAREREQIPIQQEKADLKAKFTGWMKRCIIQTGTLVGGKRQNEDAVFSFQSSDGRVSSVGVFDGHGQLSFAAVCSRISVKVTKTWFQRFGDEMPDWEPHQWKQKFDQLFVKLHQLVREQFEKMEIHLRSRHKFKGTCPVVDTKGVVRTADGNPIHGGTTASICVLIRKEKGEQYLVTAYVGDSDVLIAKEGPTTHFELATEGHRALNKREFARIKNLPKETYPVKLDLVYDVQGVKDSRLLPKVYNHAGEIDASISKHPRLYGLYSSNIRKEPATYAVTPSNITIDRVRLANTRAIGDFYAEQFGVAHIPEVLFERLPSNESFFIIAGSDGVWDTWEYHDVVSWLQKVTKKEAMTEMHVQDFLLRTKCISYGVFGNMAAVDDSSLCVIHAPKHEEEETQV